MREDVTKQLGRSVDRRTFLKACGVFGVGAVAGGALQAATRAIRLGPRRVAVERTLLRMGSFVSITAVHPSRDLCDEAIGRAVEEMDRLAGILSRHDPSTPLSLLNREGSLRDAPPELLDVIAESLRAHGESGGAFDPTVQPVLDLFENARESDGGRLPDGDAVRAALARVGARRIEIDGRRLRFRGEGMRLTLDGIAPGYIVDRVSEVLSRHGVENHLVNASGDIRARGRRADGRLWRIAVEDPEKRGHYPEVIELGSGSVSTSGGYEVYFDREKLHHHIIDPATGASPRFASSVSVISPASVRSDALSTALLVTPPERGIELVESLPGTHALVLGRQGESYRSNGWDAFATAKGGQS